MSVIQKGIALDYGAGITAKKFTIDYATIIATITGDVSEGDIPLFTLPAYAIPLMFIIKPTTQFACAGQTVRCSVGIDGSHTLFTAAIADMVANAPSATNDERSAALPDPGTTAALDVILNVVVGSGHVHAMTAGVVDVYVYYLNPTTPLP